MNLPIVISRTQNGTQSQDIWEFSCALLHRAHGSSHTYWEKSHIVSHPVLCITALGFGMYVKYEGQLQESIEDSLKSTQTTISVGKKFTRADKHKLHLEVCMECCKYRNKIITFRKYWIYMTRFWQQGDYRGGFCEKMLKASPTSDSSKKDPLLAKAEAISDAGSTSENILRTGKSFCAEAVRED